MQRVHVYNRRQAGITYLTEILVVKNFAGTRIWTSDPLTQFFFIVEMYNSLPA